MPKYIVRSSAEAEQAFKEFKMKRYGWFPAPLAIAFADEAKTGRIKPARLTHLGNLMEALDKANRRAVFSEALPEAKNLTMRKGAKHGIAHLIRVLEQHVELPSKPQPATVNGLGITGKLRSITLKKVGRALTTPIPLGRRLETVDKFLHTPLSLGRARRVLSIPFSFRSNAKPLILDIKDDHAAFYALHGRIDDKTASTFASVRRPSPAVLARMIKELGLSRASTPVGVKKDLQSLAERFHLDRLKGIDETSHRRVVDLINSARDFLKHTKSL